MQMFKETDVLDELFRKNVIEEILGSENQNRKAKQYKRYEIYNDKVNKYTEDLLLSQFDASTVEEMRISLTNVSLCKKIINKISRVYSNGVRRDFGKSKKKQAATVESLSKYLCFDSNMKKANRYLQLHNNIWVTVLPTPIRDVNGVPVSYELKMSVVPPFLFDVIENSDDREKASCLILSNFDVNKTLTTRADVLGRLGQRSLGATSRVFSDGDGRDQIIADTPTDRDSDKFIWWTDSFHFVTNKAGQIISGGEILNPISTIPGCALNKDQDGSYYSIAGDDLVDSCLLANAMLTNINHIGIQQGYGQAYMIGKNLPSQIRLGPTKCVKLEASSDGEKPEFGYATSNPPLEDLKQLTVTQIALLLSTNNLSTSNVKVDLSNANSMASGISMMIDKSELTEDVNDQARIFLDSEKKIWQVILSWRDLYNSKGLLSENVDTGLVDLSELRTYFGSPAPIVSESESLANLKLRKELGLNTTKELLMKDRPDYSEKDAEDKLIEIREEKKQALDENREAFETKDDGSDDEGDVDESDSVDSE